MSRASHYTEAKLLWKTVAYCDQWKKVMAVYDELDNLRAVVKEGDSGNGEYDVLLIGSNTEMLYVIDGLKLGSTAKNMKACFRIYYELQKVDVPVYIPSFRHTGWLYLDQIFVHSKLSARRLGGFHKTAENIASEKIAKALKHYEESIKRNVGVIDCVSWYECLHDYGDDDGDYDDISHYLRQLSN